MAKIQSPGPWLLSLSNFFSLKSNFRSVSCLVRHWLRVPSHGQHDLQKIWGETDQIWKTTNHIFFCKICAPVPLLLNLKGNIQWSGPGDVVFLGMFSADAAARRFLRENGNFLASLWDSHGQIRKFKEWENQMNLHEISWNIFKYIQICANIIKPQSIWIYDIYNL